jgi:DNA-binding transcriptional MerR regulator
MNGCLDERWVTSSQQKTRLSRVFFLRSDLNRIGFTHSDECLNTKHLCRCEGVSPKQSPLELEIASSEKAPPRNDILLAKPWYHVVGFIAYLNYPMASRPLRTNEIARELGVHPNTVRLYETWGYLSEVPRGRNGYRQYSTLHLEQARLAHLTLSWPYLGEKVQLIELVKSAARGDLGMAMELAYQYLARVRMERTSAEAALEFLERWAAGHRMDSSPQNMHIRQAARHLNVTVDMLRNWERNGLITVPRDPENGYRLYGPAEFERLRVIRILVQSGYSLMAILRMLARFDKGERTNLRESLNLPPEEDMEVQVVADRWLASLVELEERAQAIIRQIGRMIEMTPSR